MSQNLSSAAVMIGTLRAKGHFFNVKNATKAKFNYFSGRKVATISNVLCSDHTLGFYYQTSRLILHIIGILSFSTVAILKPSKLVGRIQDIEC